MTGRMWIIFSNYLHPTGRKRFEDTGNLSKRQWAKEDFERKHQLQSEGIRFEHVVHRVSELLEVSPEQVLAGGKHKETVVARSLLCFWATAELAISQVELGQKLKISQPAVSMAVRRGEQLASRYSYSLKE